MSSVSVKSMCYLRPYFLSLLLYRVLQTVTDAFYRVLSDPELLTLAEITVCQPN